MDKRCTSPLVRLLSFTSVHLPGWTSFSCHWESRLLWLARPSEAQASANAKFRDKTPSEHVI